MKESNEKYEIKRKSFPLLYHLSNLRILKEFKSDESKLELNVNF